MARYFAEGVAIAGDAKLAANWIMVELSARLNASDMDTDQCPVSAEHLGQMVRRIIDGTISTRMAKDVLQALWDGEGDPDTIIDKRGLKQVSDSRAIEAMVDEVIANSPKQVENYRSADDAKRPKMLGYFVGQVMKASKGQANPQQVNEVLLRKLDEQL